MLKYISVASLIAAALFCSAGCKNQLKKSPATAPISIPTTLPTETISLWPDGMVPGSLGTDPVKDIPTITIYRPAKEKASGAAIVICPGGSYRGLANHEGRDYALWLTERGITGIVLKYRLGSNGYRHPAMLHDVQRALRLVRFRAAEWNLDPNRVGVMGSSAGGHLASTVLTHFDAGNPGAIDPIDKMSCRPDLGVLCYPVINMGIYTHAGSRENLLGKEPSPELVELLSNETQVTSETPKCFIWHTREDKTVKVENSLNFAAALLKNGVPHDLHIYQNGGHGLGLGMKGYMYGVTRQDQLLPWTFDLDYWLKINQFTASAKN